MLNPVAFAFCFVSMLTGVLAGFFSRMKWYTNIFGIIGATFIISVLAAVVSSVIQLFVFGGVTGAGVDLITIVFVTAGKSLWEAVMGVYLVTGFITVLVNWGISMIIIRKIPDRFLIKLNYGLPYIKKGDKKHE